MKRRKLSHTTRRELSKLKTLCIGYLMLSGTGLAILISQLVIYLTRHKIFSPSLIAGAALMLIFGYCAIKTYYSYRGVRGT